MKEILRRTWAEIDLDALGQNFQAVRQAAGDLRGISRYGDATIPMDEALCFTALDFSNRPFLVFDAEMPQPMIGGYDSCLTEEFMRALAMNSGLTLHTKALYGKNAHHITEAQFKSLGVAIKDAVQAGIVGAEVPMYLLGVVTAAVSGYLCIRLLKYVADKGRFGAFAYYCWAVGILTLVLQAVK